VRALIAALLISAGCAPEHSVLGRPYDLQQPRGVDATTPLPLVILAHGYSANGALQDLVFPFSKLVEPKQFLYALPNGTVDRIGKRFWNATDFCCNFENLPVDDVAFFRALIADVQAHHAVSPGRVFVIGHSNGAFMALRLACEASDVIDGIAAISGSTWEDFARCPDGRKIPVLLVHGTADDTILYDGEAGKYPAAHVTGQRFAARAGCDTTWHERGRVDFVGDATAETHQETMSCDPAIELWSVEGAGHVPSFHATWTEAVIDWLFEHAT
jgi:polyhydroxybutyrate depolymerase